MARASWYDFDRYMAHANLLEDYSVASVRRLETRLVKEFHKLEKGLALADPRPGRGIAAALHTVSLLARLDALSPDSRIGREARIALASYLELGRAHLDPEVVERIEAGLAGAAVADDAQGATRRLTRAHVEAAAAFDLEAFVRTRASVRDFGPEAPSPAVVERAVELARWAPSVCNRQCTRVHLFTDPGVIGPLLDAQGGARAFADRVPMVAMVTAWLGAFNTPPERYQCWIDGGLFAMSFLNALHWQAVGACPLNWARSPYNDKVARSVTGIPHDENIVMLVAVGALRDEYRVARSRRLEPSEILVQHGPGPSSASSRTE